MSLTPFGAFTIGAFLAASTSTLWRARDRAALWRCLPGLLAACVLVGYACSFATKWLLYHTVLGLDDDVSSGTHFYGVAIGAAVATWLYARRVGLDYAMFADAAFPSVLLGSAVGRVGCYFGGCCGGGVDLPVPVQLLSSSLDLTGYAVVACLVRGAAMPAGRAATAAVVWYGSIRFGIEFLRNEPRLVAGLTLAQLLAVATVATALLLHTTLAVRSPTVLGLKTAR